MAAKKSDQTDMNLFSVLNKHDMSSVKIEDEGLKRYINLEAENIFHGGIFANKLFAKSKLPIVERLINNVMRTEKYNGKKLKAYKVVRGAFEIIDKRAKSNFKRGH